jgi:hypothetical protein
MKGRRILQRFARQRKPLSRRELPGWTESHRPVALQSANEKAPDDAGALKFRERRDVEISTWRPPGHRTCS